MFRSVSDGWSLWDTLLPAEARQLPAELAQVDVVLDHPELLEVFRPEFSAERGRRSIPMETFVRLMYLKWSNRWGYDRLVENVAGSITYKVFTRIPITERVPDASTLKHLARRFRPETIERLNQTLIDLAERAGTVDVSRVRVDSTIVDANIAYPTDSGLLTKVVRQLFEAAMVLSARLGLDARVHDFTGEVKDLNRRLGARARTRGPDRHAEILALTDELADLAGEAGCAAQTVHDQAVAALAGVDRAPRRTRRALARLTQALDALPALVNQAKARARQEPVPAAAKRLSIRDRDARPIRKGSTRRGTQFGYTAQIVEDNAGLIIDYQVCVGQPADAELITPAIGRITNRYQTPTIVAADKTYGTAQSRQDLAELGIATVAIAHKANQTPPHLAPEQRRTLTVNTRWRAGIEARVSTLKRDHGWDRTRMANHTGTRTWLGFGVFAHNTRKLARLL